MKYSEFLDTVKVLRMLYGRHIAEQYFKKNVGQFYNLNSTDLKNLLADSDSVEYDETNAQVLHKAERVAQ